jgi:hypothetical protein
MVDRGATVGRRRARRSNFAIEIDVPLKLRLTIAPTKKASKKTR